MSSKKDFTVTLEQAKQVRPRIERIQELFNVIVKFTSQPRIAERTGQEWIEVSGQFNLDCENSKKYIQALTNPEKVKVIDVPECLVTELERNSEYLLKKYEKETICAISKVTDAKIVIKGDNILVVEDLLAQKAIEIQNAIRDECCYQDGLENITLEVKEFAMKLGYNMDDIALASVQCQINDQEVNENTLLQYLLLYTPEGDVNQEQDSYKSDMAQQPDKPTESTTVQTIALPTYSEETEDSKSSCSPTSSSSTATTPPTATQQPDTHTSSTSTAAPAAPSTTSSSTTASSLERTSSSSASTASSTSSSSDAAAAQIATSSATIVAISRSTSEGQDLLPSSTAIQLRDIIIDGSNVAMCHGSRDVFSCRGIEIAIEWFKARGHTHIVSLVPQWRKETSKPEAPIVDQEVLLKLEKKKLLFFTPSRKLIDGRRVTCYDDKFILKYASTRDSIIVSNDNFRDLQKENPQWKSLIEQRLLMFSFINDIFMPPDDPLGRHGPNLETFLQKGSMLAKPCPYKNKCTYGNKCRFFHPPKTSATTAPTTSPSTNTTSDCNNSTDQQQQQQHKVDAKTKTEKPSSNNSNNKHYQTNSSSANRQQQQDLQTMHRHVVTVDKQQTRIMQQQQQQQMGNSAHYNANYNASQQHMTSMHPMSCAMEMQRSQYMGQYEYDDDIIARGAPPPSNDASSSSSGDSNSGPRSQQQASQYYSTQPQKQQQPQTRFIPTVQVRPAFSLPPPRQQPQQPQRIQTQNVQPQQMQAPPQQMHSNYYASTNQQQYSNPGQPAQYYRQTPQPQQAQQEQYMVPVGYYQPSPQQQPQQSQAYYQPAPAQGGHQVVPMATVTMSPHHTHMNYPPQHPPQHTQIQQQMPPQQQQMPPQQQQMPPQQQRMVQMQPQQAQQPQQYWPIS